MPRPTKVIKRLRKRLAKPPTRKPTTHTRRKKTPMPQSQQLQTLEQQIRAAVLEAVAPVVNTWVDEMVASEMSNSVARIHDALGIAPANGSKTKPHRRGGTHAAGTPQANFRSDQQRRVTAFLQEKGQATAEELAESAYPEEYEDDGPERAAQLTRMLCYRASYVERVPGGNRPRYWRLPSKAK